jgi:hypothetical protein
MTIEYLLFHRADFFRQLVDTPLRFRVGIQNDDELQVQGFLGEALRADPIAFVPLHFQTHLPALDVGAEQVRQGDGSIRAVAGQNVAGVDRLDQAAIGRRGLARVIIGTAAERPPVHADGRFRAARDRLA